MEILTADFLAITRCILKTRRRPLAIAPLRWPPTRCAARVLSGMASNRGVAFLASPLHHCNGMRRLLVSVLLITLLVGGFEVATDYHEALASAPIGLDADHSPLSHEASGTCDHCCHAGAHFTGVVIECGSSATPAAQLFASIVTRPVLIAGKSPPTHPPKA